MDAIEAHEHAANQYDQQALEWGWNPEFDLDGMTAVMLKEIAEMQNSTAVKQ